MHFLMCRVAWDFTSRLWMRMFIIIFSLKIILFDFIIYNWYDALNSKSDEISQVVTLNNYWNRFLKVLYHKNGGRILL